MAEEAMFRRLWVIGPFALSLSKAPFSSLELLEKFRSYFDRLSMNGIFQSFPSCQPANKI